MRATAVLAGAAVVGSMMVGLAIAGPARADTAPVRDGSTSALAAPSCWAIKQQNPAAQNGVYWLQTSTLIDPQQFYCDQTTDGGGWVLIGRGRDGWNWSAKGQGSLAALRNTPTGTAAFAPATLPSDTVDGLLDGTRVDALTDGVRLVRSTNAAGTATQEVRIKASNRAQWSWSFGGGVNVSSISFGSATYGGGQTFSYSADNYYNSLVTYQTSAHHYRMGFGFGSSISGSNSPTSYIWSYGSERNALPFTQVWLRPKLMSSTYTTIPQGGLPASPIRAMVSDQTSLSTPWGVTGVHGGGEDHVEVEALTQIGNTVYVGGDFTYVQKGANPAPGEQIAQPYVAAFDLNTGEWRSAFRPAVNGTVWDLQGLPNGELAIGGEFTTVNGQSVPAFAVVDGTTGALATDFNTQIGYTAATASSPDLVRALDIQGNWLYIAGRFNRVSGGIAQPLNNVVVGRITRVSLTDGKPDGTWKPNFDGTIGEIDASSQGDRLYAVGWFNGVNGQSSPNEATISTSGNGSLVPGLGQWTPSAGSGPTAKYQQAIKETDNGYVWQGGSEHILEQFDRGTYTMKKSFITRNGNVSGGGDIQTIALQDGVMFASCHCDNYVYTDDLSWGNPLASNTDVHNINLIGAWDATTGQYLQNWWPSGLDGRQGLGAWELMPDTNGCLWFGGDFDQGSWNPATDSYQWLGGFGKFCQNDSTPPTTPGAVSVNPGPSGAALSWGASTDNSGDPVTYEVLRNDRVIATTNNTSYTDTSATYPATYFVRAMDSSGNRSASTVGVTTQGPDVTPPTAPTNVTATALSAVSAQLSWTASTDDTGVTGYQVSRNGQPLPGTVTGTTFTDTGLTGGTTYSYTVAALDAAGNVSAASAAATVTTPNDNPVVFGDTWTNADGSAWQSAWTCTAVNGAATTANNAGVLSFNDASGSYARAQLSGVAAQTDGTVLLSYQWNATTAAEFLSVYLRGSGGWQNSYRPKTGYGLQLQSNSGTVSLQKNVNGTLTTLQNVAGGQSITTGKQWLRLQVNGSTIQFRTWVDGQPEPAVWKSVVTDASIPTSGQLFLSLNRGSTNVGNRSVAIDDLQLFNA